MKYQAEVFTGRPMGKFHHARRKERERRRKNRRMSKKVEFQYCTKFIYADLWENLSLLHSLSVKFSVWVPTQFRLLQFFWCLAIVVGSFLIVYSTLFRFYYWSVRGNGGKKTKRNQNMRSKHGKNETKKKEKNDRKAICRIIKTGCNFSTFQRHGWEHRRNRYSETDSTTKLKRILWY